MIMDKAASRIRLLSRGRRLPFFRSICTCFQVLNFGNNILQFRMGAWCLSWTNVKLYWLI